MPSAYLTKSPLSFEFQQTAAARLFSGCETEEMGESISVESEFLRVSVERLTEFTERIEICLDKMTPEQIWLRHAENENAAGNLVLHLTGNLRQWMLSGVGGEPDTRVRDREFAARGGLSRDELKHTLRPVADRVVALLRSLPPGRLLEPLSRQGYNGTVLSGVYHVVEHYAQHTAQIIFMTKFFTGQDLGFYRHLSNPRAQGSPTA